MLRLDFKRALPLPTFFEREWCGVGNLIDHPSMCFRQSSLIAQRAQRSIAPALPTNANLTQPRPQL